MLESYKWMGWVGWDWKSLKALILRAPLCGANKGQKDEQIKRQRPKREYNIVMSGQFCTLVMF